MFVTERFACPSSFVKLALKLVWRLCWIPPNDGELSDNGARKCSVTDSYVRRCQYQYPLNLPLSPFQGTSQSSSGLHVGRCHGARLLFLFVYSDFPFLGRHVNVMWERSIGEVLVYDHVTLQVTCAAVQLQSRRGVEWPLWCAWTQPPLTPPSKQIFISEHRCTGITLTWLRDKATEPAGLYEGWGGGCFLASSL